MSFKLPGPAHLPENFAIACSTGGFKSVFLHGVLSVFEREGLRAKCYGAASSSVLPAAAAATGRTSEMGIAYWQEGIEILAQPGTGMSQMILAGLEKHGPRLRDGLFTFSAPRFIIAVSAVNPASAEEVQGKSARRLGRKLLLAAARGEKTWVDENLKPEIFDTHSSDLSKSLTADNFLDAAYASSRMLHAWDIPAWIAGRPFVDAYYTCACPAENIARLGYAMVIALSNEPRLYRDIFRQEAIMPEVAGVPIHIIAPDVDPASLGVDYTVATRAGLFAVYAHGEEQAYQFLKNFV